jgi:hypothetical protein
MKDGEGNGGRAGVVGQGFGRAGSALHIVLAEHFLGISFGKGKDDQNEYEQNKNDTLFNSISFHSHGLTRLQDKT